MTTKPFGRRWAALLMAGAVSAVTLACTSSQVGEAVRTGATAAGASEKEAAGYGAAAGNLVSATGSIDPATERALGDGVAVKIFDRLGPRLADEKVQEYVNLVGRSLTGNSSRAELPFAFGVVENDTVAAYAAPGGYIFITTGALALMENEAELAGVLGHEITHVNQRHMEPLYRTARLLDAAQFAAQASGDVSEEQLAKYSDLADQVTDAILNKGFGPAKEYEADQMGVELAAVSGYDPNGLADFLRKMQAMESHSGGWFSTHPPTSSRIGRLETHTTQVLGGMSGAQGRTRFQKVISGMKPSARAQQPARGAVTKPGESPAATQPGTPVQGGGARFMPRSNAVGQP
ncbi:MAG: M48 family metalloprotease [Sumerlaeia bacterium]